MANEFLADLLRRVQAIIAATANTFFPGIVDPDYPGPVFGPWQNVRNHVPYMPEWTDPAWSSTVEYSADGTKKRDIYVNTGTILRPAILPGDAAKNPTAFARYAKLIYYTGYLCIVTYLTETAASASIPKLGRMMKTQLSVNLSSPRQQSTQARPRRAHLERQRAGSRLFLAGRRPKRSVL
jgi:hypothetical protein